MTLSMLFVVAAMIAQDPAGAPLEQPSSSAAHSDPPLPVTGTAPLDQPPPPSSRDAPPAAAPFGEGPSPPRPEVLDRKHTLMTRLDFMLGPIWRTTQVDTMLGTSLEVGQMHGFSGSFHTAFIIDGQERNLVTALDVPIGVGAVARGRLRNKPLFASIGLTAGILVHRAKTEGRVIHRVDPDFTLPIRFAWTIARVGLSLEVRQGWSVRDRSYETRGSDVWHRDAYRVALLIGLHWDKVVGRVGRKGRGR